MRKTILLLPLLFFAATLTAQNLDHMAFGSGGAVTDNCNFVIGEIFNFTMASDGDIVIETGSLGSDDNTGGSFPDIVGQFAETTIKCYPNPAHHLLTVDLGGAENIDGVVVLNELGQMVLQAKPNGAKAYLNVQGLAVGNYYVTTLQGKKVTGINKIVKQ